MKGKSRPSPVHHFFVLLSLVIGPIGCPEMGWWAQSQSCDGEKKVADDVVSKYTSAGEKKSLAHIVSCLAGCSTFFYIYVGSILCVVNREFITSSGI